MTEFIVITFGSLLLGLLFEGLGVLGSSDEDQQDEDSSGINISMDNKHDMLRVDLEKSHLNQHLSGSDDQDIIYGTSEVEVIFGGSANDEILGGSGNDTIFGGNGSDLLDGGTGDDLFFGDQFEFTYNAVEISNGSNDQYVTSGDQFDDTIFGGSGNDTLYGEVGDDILDGGSGDDVLVAGLGLNILDGGSGLDTLIGTYNWSDSPDGNFLFGGDQDDSIFMGTMDVASGGLGSDIFQTQSNANIAGQYPIITDFDPSSDRIKIHFDFIPSHPPEISIEIGSTGETLVLLDGVIAIGLSNGVEIQEETIELIYSE